MNDYNSKMKFWVITNSAGVRRIFSGVTADEARANAKNHNPELFGSGELQAERQGSYAQYDTLRNRRSRPK